MRPKEQTPVLKCMCPYKEVIRRCGHARHISLCLNRREDIARKWSHASQEKFRQKSALSGEMAGR